MPFALGFVVGSMLSPILARRVRPAVLMTAGLLVAAVGFAALAQVGGVSGLPLVVSSTIGAFAGRSSGRR